ncbi:MULTISPECIES: TadE/TadG family type IV pilus assembly protein [Variovorax]|nr:MULTISPECIES: TadE/TadG family type IV pilus assembly protein [Variovorax]MDQ0072196.1 Flp pilus assembly protein TadG [Variovorax boronicumulans]
MTIPRSHSAAHGQRGIYAIEFAIVFLLFFALLYAIVCYGLVVALRFGLQNAAEDGARAALRYQLNLPARQVEAEAVALLRSNWMPAVVTRDADANVCQVATNNCTSPVCGVAWEDRCQMVVTITATNMRQLLPPLPSFAVPSQLIGQASMLLDGRKQ